MKKYSAIITDMDGLLIDSEHMGWMCWSEVLVRLGFPLTYEEFLPTVGKGRREFVKWLVERNGPSFPAEESLRLRVEIGDEYIAKHGMARKPGVEELLSFVSGRALPFGLATSTFREESEKRLRAANIPLSLFGATVCGDEVEKIKPAPDLYLKAAKGLNIDPSQIVVLEDSGTGARAALAAGMSVIVIPDLVPVPEEVRSQAHAECRDLHEALQVLQEIFL